MSKSRNNLLVSQDKCPICGVLLPALPPCPRCGNPVPVFIDVEQYEEIISFLTRHKGSQCRVMLGKKDGKNILVYELLTKKQLQTP